MHLVVDRLGLRTLPQVAVKIMIQGPPLELHPR